jgi:hypothetical protein
MRAVPIQRSNLQVRNDEESENTQADCGKTLNNEKPSPGRETLSAVQMSQNTICQCTSESTSDGGRSQEYGKLKVAARSVKNIQYVKINIE